MKCILLCAGYATRLFPLTENFPKALLQIGDKPLLDYILNEVNTIDEIDKIYVVTNNKYTGHFTKWAESKNNIKPIEVINDNTNSNDDRLGAVGDIRYVIKNKEINDDIIVIAGDNLFEFKLKDMVKFFKEKNASCAAAQYINDVEYIKNFGVAKLDDNFKVLNLVEKPKNPETNIGVWATYIYPKSIVPFFDKYFEEGNKGDSPGSFVQYIYTKKDVYLYMFDGRCFDVGTHESLKEVNEIYSVR